MQETIYSSDEIMSNPDMNSGRQKNGNDFDQWVKAHDEIASIGASPTEWHETYEGVLEEDSVTPVEEKKPFTTSAYLLKMAEVVSS